MFEVFSIYLVKSQHFDYFVLNTSLKVLHYGLQVESYLKSIFFKVWI